jgi:O-antigen/teichoic acid export membrane protein
MPQTATSRKVAAETASRHTLAPDSKPALPRRLAINFLFLSCGESLAKLLTFVSFSFLARTLGPWNYGMVEFTLALMVFFTLPVDLGLGSYGAREIARNPQNADRLLHEITGLRLMLALCSMVALGIFVAVIHKSTELKLLLLLYGLSLLGGPFLLQWFFQAHDQMRWVGGASVIRQAAFALVVLAFCRKGAPLIYVGVAECFSVGMVAAFCLYVTRHQMHYAWPLPDLRISHLTKHLSEALPIGLSEVAWAFMWYFCTVLLGFIFADRSLAWFGASHRALMALHTFVWLYFFNLLPSISRCVVLPKKQLLDLMDHSIRFAAWIGLLAAGMLGFMAPLLLGLIYGPAFRAAASSFRVLAWMLPVAMLSGHYRYTLIAYSRQKTLLVCTAYSALAAVVLGFMLVPLYDGMGAAWALLIANVLNLVLVYFAVKRLVTKVPVGRQLVSPMCALAAAAGLYACLAVWNIWVAGVVSCGVYIGALLWADGPRLLLFLRATIRKPALASQEI